MTYATPPRMPFLFLHSHPLTAAIPAAMHTPSCTLPPGIFMDVDRTQTFKPLAQTCYRCGQTSHNRFACLEVDTPIEPLICVTNSTEVVQTPSHPPIANRRSCLPAWERQLPVKYIITASPGPMSLAVDVEIESTDTTVK
jgi:hypothetical protein